jgi:prephenate dehydrogenase
MRVGIVGLGLIGGSLGRALRGLTPRVAVVGVTRRSDAAAVARARGAVDDASTDFAILRNADIVVVATPIDQIPDVLDQLAPLAIAGAVITDVASVKRPVRAWVRRLPEPGLFLGGHPVAGKAQSGIEASDPAIFRGEAWIFTPLEAQNLRPFQAWFDLVAAIGARPAFLTPEEHDRELAYLSHLAFTVSAAFEQTVRENADPALGGPGYRSMVRLAGGDRAMYESIAHENREPLLTAINRFSRTLEALRDRIERGEPMGQIEAGRHVAV